MKAAPSVMPHYNYARYIIDNGTPEERRGCRETLETMGAFLEIVPGGHWEPMDSIRLIDHLMHRAEEIALNRWNAANKQHYRDHQGKVGRTLDEEMATVRGHLAAQMMLGLPLGKPDTKEEARVQGNIGQGNEAFIPLHNPVGHNLIVDPKTPEHVVSWLVVPEGERSFRLAGWILAEDAKQELYKKSRQREGGASISYWVPPKMLKGVGDWWATRN